MFYTGDIEVSMKDRNHNFEIHNTNALIIMKGSAILNDDKILEHLHLSSGKLNETKGKCDCYHCSELNPRIFVEVLKILMQLFLKHARLTPGNRKKRGNRALISLSNLIAEYAFEKYINMG